jgi:phosphatidylglycerophosphatase C
MRDTPPVAVFDLDGTLLRGDSLLPFLLRYGWRRRRLALAFLAWYVLLYACRAVSARAAKERLLRRFLGGEPASVIGQEVARFCDGWVRRQLNEPVLRRLREHQAAGHRVILLTASPCVYVPAVADLLGIREVVCTRVKWQGETCVGEIDGANCKGEDKLRLLQSYLAGTRSLAGSYAYGDSRSDLPVLQWASRGFLVEGSRIRLCNGNHD